MKRQGKAHYKAEADYSLYTGKELPFTWTELSEKAKKNDLADIRVGDYKIIVLSNQEDIYMEVAGINTYVGYGEIPLGTHIDFISRDCLKKRYAYNLKPTNSGGYVCSHLNMVLQMEILPLIPTKIRQLIVNKRGLVECKLGKNATAWSWQNLGKLWLPTEVEVWGCGIFCEKPWGYGLTVQYPIFHGTALHIVKRLGVGGDRYNWWTGSTAAGSPESFCHVGRFGLPNQNPAMKEFGVPICFRIA